MSTRAMKHPGVVKSMEPAKTTRYFDSESNKYVTQEIAPAKEITIKLTNGTTFGSYPVNRVVNVPARAQASLYRHGFRFVKTEDEKAFLQEQEAAAKPKAVKAVDNSTEGGN